MTDSFREDKEHAVRPAHACASDELLLVYLAEVCGNLSGTAPVLLFVLGFGTICYVIIAGVSEGEASLDPAQRWDYANNQHIRYPSLYPEPTGERPKSVDPLRHHIWIVPVLIFFAVITPSRNTVYAIAASELGEEVLKSPVATKAGQALEAWLDAQIKQAETTK